MPTDAGELAAGDVTVTGTAGKLSLGRASISRGAVAGRLPADLPPLKIFNRSWVDRDGGEDAVPAEFASQFSVEALGPDARAAYVDSGAWRHLVDGSSHIDGVTVEDDTVVLVSRRCLDPERTAALTAATQEFLSTAARSVDDAGSRPAKVDNPLPVS